MQTYIYTVGVTDPLYIKEKSLELTSGKVYCMLLFLRLIISLSLSLYKFAFDHAKGLL